MGDSLQSYFSNLLGGSSSGNGVGIGGAPEIISDNARSPRLSASAGDLGYDWFTDCCSMDTTAVFGGAGTGLCGLTFNRWDSVPTYETPEHGRTKQDTAPIKRPRRRPLPGEGSESDSPVLDEDYAAIYLPTEEALDGHGRRSSTPPPAAVGGTATSATIAAATKPSLTMRND